MIEKGRGKLMETEKGRAEIWEKANTYTDKIEETIKKAAKSFRNDSNVLTSFKDMTKTLLELRDAIELKDSSVNIIIAMKTGDYLGKQDEDEEEKDSTIFYRRFLHGAESNGIKPANNCAGDRVEVDSCVYQMLEGKNPKG